MKLLQENIEEFRAALRSAGLEPPDEITADGELHRFRVEDDRPSTRNGWYVFHYDELAAGAFGCWKRGIHETWCSTSRSELDPKTLTKIRKNIETSRAAAEKKRLQEQDRAAEKAAQLLARLAPAELDHPYLGKKQIEIEGCYQLSSPV